MLPRSPNESRWGAQRYSGDRRRLFPLEGLYERKKCYHCARQVAWILCRRLSTTLKCISRRCRLLEEESPSRWCNRQQLSGPLVNDHVNMKLRERHVWRSKLTFASLTSPSSLAVCTPVNFQLGGLANSIGAIGTSSAKRPIAVFQFDRVRTTVLLRSGEPAFVLFVKESSWSTRTFGATTIMLIGSST